MSRHFADIPMIPVVNRKGAPYLRPRSCDRYFWQNVVEEGGCWRWTGEMTTGGYGRISRLRTLGERYYVRMVAHRYAYEDLIGPVEPGLDLDHLCRNRWCVNPYHLDPVPPAVNHERGRLARGMAA